MDTPIIDANPTHYLKRVDRDTPSLQFVRELVQNGIEANAQNIKIRELKVDLPQQQGPNKTTSKFMVSDDGDGMTARFMYEHLAKMNSSSKSLNSDYHENFGIGAKITTAMWNPYGVVFCSWHKDKPDQGHLVWLHYNKKYNAICLKGFKRQVIEERRGQYSFVEEQITTTIQGRNENIIPLLDEDGDPHELESSIKWHELRPKPGHGTVVVLMGESPEDNTWTDSNRKPLSEWALVRYLNTRYKSFPQGLHITSGALRSDGRKNPRTIKGFDQTLSKIPNQFLQSREVVNCPNGFRVEVIITKDHANWNKEYREKRNYKSGSGGGLVYNLFGGAAFNKGFVAIQYGTGLTEELYNIKNNHHKSLYPWGISSRAMVSRVKLIIHVPQLSSKNKKRGVYPNEGRYRLQWKDEDSNSSNEIDLSEVQDYFIENHPQSIKDLREEAYAEYKARAVDLNKIFEKYQDILRLKRSRARDLICDEDGNFRFNLPEPKLKKEDDDALTKGRDNEGNPAKKASRKTGDEAEEGSLKGKKIKKAKEPKEIVGRWLTYFPDQENVTDAFEENGIEYPVFIEELSDKYVVNLMKNHPLFVDIMQHFANKKKTLTLRIIEDNVKEQHIGYFTSYIRHLEGMKIKNNRLYLSLQTLHAKVMGAYELWDRIAHTLQAIGK
tara:strand:+ start:496 stop:2493 length:1998 start_codon:yes stop_codon:yes gene_type:complete